MRNKRHGRGRRGQQHGQLRSKGFLQPCLLLQLYEKDCHGYELLAGLEEFLDSVEEMDPSIIYRLMREMEEKELVESYSGEYSRGPKRRMYRLTTAGRSYLQISIEELKQFRTKIDRLLSIYKSLQK